MTEQDINFYRIRNFILFSQKENMEKAAALGQQWKPHNWKLDRINFAASVSCRFHRHTFEQIMDKVLFLPAENPKNRTEEFTGLRAIAMTEGEFQGECFLFTSGAELTEREYEKILDFAETECACSPDEKGLRSSVLHIDPRDSLFIRTVENRGYTLDTGWAERESVIHLEDADSTGVMRSLKTKGFKHQLPEGFTLIDNTEGKITPEMKIHVHYNAFQIYAAEKKPITEEIIQARIPAWNSLKQMPDYNPSLDLMILDSNGKPAAMMGFWFDVFNGITIIEPAGTHPDYQRKGLGRYLIEEGSARAKKLGSKELWVGNEMDFYNSCGFQCVHEINIWTKKIRGCI